jgi:H+/Cl- antiporter ClcA
MCRTGSDTIPPVLGILVLGILCIISGLYFAFFYSRISYLASYPLQLSPYDVFGNLLIIAGIILLLIGSYRQKNSPAY